MGLVPREGFTFVMRIDEELGEVVSFIGPISNDLLRGLYRTIWLTRGALKQVCENILAEYAGGLVRSYHHLDG